MFNSVEATDENLLYKSKSIYFTSFQWVNNERLKKFFLPSNLFIFSSDDHTYGPFGTDSIRRKPVTILIGNGDVLSQATFSFFYDGFDKIFKSVECFSFYVSNEIRIFCIMEWEHWTLM